MCLCICFDSVSTSRDGATNRRQPGTQGERYSKVRLQQIDGLVWSLSNRSSTARYKASSLPEVSLRCFSSPYVSPKTQNECYRSRVPHAWVEKRHGEYLAARDPQTVNNTIVPCRSNYVKKRNHSRAMALPKKRLRTVMHADQDQDHARRRCPGRKTGENMQRQETAVRRLNRPTLSTKTNTLT